MAASWPLEALGAAYQLTGDARFGEHGAQALANAARRLTVEEPALDRGFYYTRTFYVRALAFGYDWLWDKLSAADRRAVKSTLLGFVTDIHEQSQTGGWGRRPLHRVWNWDPGLMGACGVGMLALEGETKLGEKGILFDCRRHLRDYLTLGVDADGCGHEGPNYLGYGIGAGRGGSSPASTSSAGSTCATETCWERASSPARSRPRSKPLRPRRGTVGSVSRRWCRGGHRINGAKARVDIF